MGLREFAQRVFTPPADSHEPAAKLVRLSSDGAVWMTWEPPFPDLETFLVEAEAVKSSIAEECPIRRVALMFTAETGAGLVLQQFPSSVQGKNKNADALAGSGNNAAKAFAEAMEGISRVVVAVLKSSEIQVTSLTKTLESQAEQIHDLIEYHRAKQELELTEQKDNTDASAMVMAQVKELLPQIPVALELFLKDKANSQVAAAAAAKATQPLVNGASKTS